MSKDDSLQQAWQSYHLIQQAVHKENVAGVTEMSERVWAALDAEEFLEQDIVQEEPDQQPESPAGSRRWGLVGGAMAAALALAVAVNFSGLTGTDPADSVQPGVASLGNIQPPQESAAVPVANSLTGESLTGESLIESAAFGDDFDYGPGFVPYSELSAADQARSDGYFMHHVQQRALNNENVLSFVKMISYPQ